MKITDMPANSRPREKLLAYGAADLTNEELLAIFIRTGIKGKSAIEIAASLLSNFGGVRGILETPQDILCQQKGFGPTKAAQLIATLELVQRHLQEAKPSKTTLSSAADAKQLLQLKLRSKAIENFGILHLTNQHEVITFETISSGTINTTSVYPREVVKSVLSQNSAAVILAHNHPSGHVEPSAADREITQRLTDALALIDVPVLDHIIIGEGDPYSFAEHGLI